MSVHPLVLASIQLQHATANARLEKLRSERNGMTTVTSAQQNRAIVLGRLIREAEAVEASWSEVSRVMFLELDAGPWGRTDAPEPEPEPEPERCGGCGEPKNDGSVHGPNQGFGGCV